MGCIYIPDKQMIKVGETAPSLELTFTQAWVSCLCQFLVRGEQFVVLPLYQSPRGREHDYKPCCTNMLIVFPEVIFLYDVLHLWIQIVLLPARFLSSEHFESFINCNSSPLLSLPRHHLWTHKTFRNTTAKSSQQQMNLRQGNKSHEDIMDGLS